MALNRREKWLLAAPALLAAAVGLYSYVHQPLYAALAQTRSDLATTHSELTRDRLRLKKEGDLSERELLLSQRQQELTDQVEGRNSATVLIYHLARAEQQSGITIHQIGLTPGKPDGELLPVDISLQVEGTFLSHILFQQATEGIPVFLTGTNLELDRRYVVVSAKSDDGKTQPPSGPALARLTYAPPLFGSYRLTLYLRPAASGPNSAGLGFQDSLGRADPFAESSPVALELELQAAFPAAKVQVPAGVTLPAAPAPKTDSPAFPNGRSVPQLG